jgi:hypothetical protein
LVVAHHDLRGADANHSVDEMRYLADRRTAGGSSFCGLP